MNKLTKRVYTLHKVINYITATCLESRIKADRSVIAKARLYTSLDRPFDIRLAAVDASLTTHCSRT